MGPNVRPHRADEKKDATRSAASEGPGGARGYVPEPPPIVEKGKHTQHTTLGKSTPRTTPMATDAVAHQPSVDMGTGNGPRIIRPRTPIQKQPMAPTTTPIIRSLRVAGARHHRPQRWSLPNRNSRIITGT